MVNTNEPSRPEQERILYFHLSEDMAGRPPERKIKCSSGHWSDAGSAAVESYTKMRQNRHLTGNRQGSHPAKWSRGVRLKKRDESLMRGDPSTCCSGTQIRMHVLFLPHSGF